LPDNWIPETRSRLERRRAKRPDTKSGQLWALWPEIKAALDDGQSVRTVLEWLKEDAGIVVSAGSFTSYISRNRKREVAQRTKEAANVFLRAHERLGSVLPALASVGASDANRSAAGAPAGDQAGTDPLERTIEALRKRRFDIREAHQNGDPTNVKLI
jgi:hypothetical protein